MYYKLIFSLVAVHLTTQLYAQDSLEVKVDTYFDETPLSSVLEFIEESSEFKFSYSNSSIPLQAKITMKEKNVSIWKVLEESLKYLPVSYEVVNNSILLKRQQLVQTIKGRVIDRDSRQPIFGATVIVLGTDPLLGATTDDEGKYRILKVPVGRLTLGFKYLGYEEGVIANVLLGSGKELVLDAELNESVINMEELVVNAVGLGSQPINEMAIVSGKSFTVEETKRFPISIGDPLRLASSFAGVSSTDDTANEIVIRGNSPRGILWRLEGTEIPNPNHFSSEGASSGGVSMFSTQVISRSDFYTGAFAPMYGNALSGVFDINLRKGNSDRHEHTIQLGFIGVDWSSEGPLDREKGSSYLFNYRYSTLGLLIKLGLIELGEDESNIFQDLSFKIYLPTKNAGTFSVFGMSGLSSYKQANPNFSFRNEEKYNMGVTGLKHEYILNKTSFLLTTLSFSGTGFIDDYVNKFNFEGSPATYSNLTSFKKSYVRGSVIYNNKVSAKHLVEWGATYSALNYSFMESQNDVSQVEPQFQEFNRFDDEGSSGTIQSFLSWKYRLGEQLTLVSGLHYFRFNFTGEQSFEPRGSLKWQFDKLQSLSFGVGIHSRLESLEYYLGNFINDDGSSVDHNSDLGLTKAFHSVMGYDRIIGAAMYFKVEAYYQRLFNVPVSASLDNQSYSTLNVSDGFTVAPLANNGVGTNYGMEFTLDRKFSNGYYFLLNSSLFESKYEGADGIERDTRFNGNFANHAVGGKEWKVGKNGRNNILGLSFKTTYSGNQRVIPIDLDASIASSADGKVTEVRNNDEIYTSRAKDYFRLDLQFSYRRNRPKSTVEWRLDIQNLTNRSNFSGDYFNWSSKSVVEHEQLFGLIPMLSWRVEF